MNAFDNPPQRTFVKTLIVCGNTPRNIRKEFVIVVDYHFVPGVGTRVQLTDAIAVDVEFVSWSPVNHCCEIRLRKCMLNEPVYSQTCKWLTEAGWKEA